MRSGMVTLTCLVLAVALTFVDWSSSAFSQDSSGAPSETLLYKPPMRGAPAGGGRIGAAVRGEEGDNPTLLALAPDHVGITSQKQPVLYWYISKPATSRIEFTLNDEQRGKTVIRVDLPSPKQAGIQAIKFSDYNAELTPGITYQWFVTLEADPGQPSKDVYYGGSSLYQENVPDLEKRLAAAGPAGAPRIYAEEGLWYDALSALWNPGKKGEEKSIRQQRIALLKQVGFGAPGPGKPQTAVSGENELLQFLSK